MIAATCDQVLFLCLVIFHVFKAFCPTESKTNGEKFSLSNYVDMSQDEMSQVDETSKDEMSNYHQH